MVSQNNDGNYYEIAVDTAKEGAEVWSLNDWFKARVGDEGTPLVMRFYTQGQLNSFDGHQKPIIQGNVGAYSFDDQKQIVMAADAKVVSWTGDASDVLPGGRVCYHFPQQMFPTEGAFYGFVGYVDESNGRRLTGVNVWFRVLGGVAQMGKACDYYINDLDIALANAKEKMRQQAAHLDDVLADANDKVQQQTNDFGVTLQRALQDLHDKYKQEAQANADASTTTRAALLKLADAVGAIQAQIDAGNVVTRIKHDNDIALLNDQVAKMMDQAETIVAEKVSQLDNGVHAYPTADAIKAAYPEGAQGLFVAVDTGHQWYYINSNWVDGGAYQAAGIDDAIATRITAATEQTKHGFDKELDRETADRTAGDQQLRSDLDGLKTIENAVELKDIDLLDDDGNPLTDQDGQHIAVQNYLPKTDMIGNQKGLPIDSSLVGDTFLSNLTKYGLPVLYLDDDRVFGLQAKKDKLSDVPYHWVNAPGNLKGEGLIKKLKVQGNSSASFPKKSYKFTLDNPGTAKRGWVSSDEYAIKAYWMDFSHLRDIGVAHLWAQMRRDRITAEDNVMVSDDGALSDQSGNALAVETDPSLTAGTTFGAIDGFPIFVVIDGKYNGFYDLIIPKSPEMAKMPDRDSTTHRAIICAEGGDICGFMQKPALNDDGTLDDGNGWSIEFVQDENDQKWIGDAVKKLYDVISADYANADDFTAAVSPYVDLDSAIDLWLLALATQSTDEIMHNFLLQTYDGKKWYFAPYDNDITFGFDDWQGTKVRKANFSMIPWMEAHQKLWAQLTKHYGDQIKARWTALRSPQGALSEFNVWYVINTLAMALPAGVYDAESKRWPAIPGTAVKDANQIITYYNMWIKTQDDVIAKH